MNAFTPVIEPEVPTLSIAGERTLRRKLGSIGQQLDRDGVDEVCVNEPYWVTVERKGVWEKLHAPDLTLERCEALAILAANLISKEFGPKHPIVFTNLPNGERFTAVGPPVTKPNRISITIRSRKVKKRTWEDLCEGGMFDEAEALEYGISNEDEELLRLYRAANWREFFPLAIAARKNIVLLGKPKSGKTTTLETMTTMIPSWFRLLTAEDAPELELEHHDNLVQTFFTRDNEGASSKVTANQIIEAFLRMTGDLAIMGELRGAEAFAYFRMVAAGNAGLTSAHAASIREMFPALVGMIREHPAASKLQDATLERWLRGIVDIGAHFERRKVRQPDGSVVAQFRCTEVYFKEAAASNRIGSAQATL